MHGKWATGAIGEMLWGAAGRVEGQKNIEGAGQTEELMQEMEKVASEKLEKKKEQECSRNQKRENCMNAAQHYQTFYTHHTVDRK